MPSNKRSASQYQTSPRKSARTSTAPTRLGYQPQEKLPTTLASVKPLGSQGIGLGVIDEDVRRYNQLLEFVPPARVKHKTVRDAHDKIQSARDEIHTIFQNAQTQICKLYNEIRWEQSMARYAAVGTMRWYNAGNILKLDLEQIEDIFEDYPLLDTRDFRRYLNDIVFPFLHVPDHAEVMNTYNMTEKIEKLFEVLAVSQDPAATLHTLQLYVEFIAGFCPYEGEFRSQKHVLYKGEIQSLSDICQEAIQRILRDAKGTNFLDCATARRTLWSAYSENTCSEQDRFRLHEYEKCFHQNHAELLHDLQKAAHREIRSNVDTVVGQIFPAELADLVFEFTLLAEDVPLDTRMAAKKDPPSYTAEVLPEYKACCSRLPYLPGGDLVD